MIITTYIIYLVATLFVTIIVARTLHNNGHLFLIDVFNGDINVARSVNALMVVGFCLLNMAIVVIAMKYGDQPHTWLEAFEIICSKVGAAVLLLGLVHFLNLFLFSQIKGWYCRKQPLEIYEFYD